MITDAITEWKEVVDSDRIDQNPERTHRFRISEIGAGRYVPAVLHPRSTEEVAAIVRKAARRGVSLYPVSRGCNWGYGGASPVVDNCVVVDLSGMDHILDFDADLGLVTVQPGVTPRQLRTFLDQHSAPFLVPVCGAGPDHSLIGNALERGYGVTPFVDHFSAVMSLEAVLPDGSVYRPALSQNGGAGVDRAFKWGLGPYMDGLFTQSNLGIVTAMTIALAPKPTSIAAFLCSLRSDDRLEEAVAAVREILKSVGNVTGSINLMNGLRVLSMVEAYPYDQVPSGRTMPQELVASLLKKNFLSPWTIGGPIFGEPAMVRAAERRISKALKQLASRIFFVNRRKIDIFNRIFKLTPDRWTGNLRKQLGHLDESFKVAEGAPSEIALPLCYWKSGLRPSEGVPMNPTRDGCGVIWYSPLVVMKPNRVRAYVDTVVRICTAHGIEPLITLTSLSNRCFDSTVPILFNPKDPHETSRARQCYLALYEAGRKEGFLPYRMSIDHIHLAVGAGGTFWDTVGRIKQALDPHGIIAPGRYCPHSS